jgi:hypothetical protein
VNRTPVCAKVAVRRYEGSSYAIYGCNLNHAFHVGRKDAGEFQVLVNVITPYVPLMSSGKDPDLHAIWDGICAVIEKAIRVAKRTALKIGGTRSSQKSIIRSRIETAAAKLSGGGKFLFSLRQLFYEIRPYLIQALGREPNYGTFGRIVGEYEDEYGEIEHLYRDDRGTLYHPHTKETMSLGTRSVAAYGRPAFAFRSLLFCEKEGLFPMLKHAGWPEQFDCALCSSKGFATRAARALIRLLHEAPEPITVFVAHDADGPGTVIYEVLQHKLENHGIEVVNLGLDPDEGRAMGLAKEPVKRKQNKRVPVAEYIPDVDKEWLQENRIELNAMTTPQFIGWLTDKVSRYFQSKQLMPKVVPPAEVLSERLEEATRVAIEQRIVEDVLKEANIPGRVQAQLVKAKRQLKAAAKRLANSLPNRLKTTPAAHWTDIVKSEAACVAAPDAGGKSVNFAESAP